ncbi:MAG: hypothetical protein ACOC2W_01285 [bacterium]
MRIDSYFESARKLIEDPYYTMKEENPEYIKKRESARKLIEDPYYTMEEEII